MGYDETITTYKILKIHLFTYYCTVFMLSVFSGVVLSNDPPECVTGPCAEGLTASSFGVRRERRLEGCVLCAVSEFI